MSFFDRLAKRLDLDDFDKRDRTAFVVLGCVTVLIFVLWFMQLQKNIVNPLYGGLDPAQLQQSTNQTDATTAADEAALKNKDTDGDGLSDWDEINIYHTSPYLADTDGDGINDYQEIKNGTDPNCPTGKDCSATTNQTTTNQTPTTNPSISNDSLINLLDQISTTTTATPQISGTVTPATDSSTTLTAEEKDALKKVLNSSNDPAVLRSFLLSSGADKTYVDSLKDSDLQKVINEILK